MHRTVLFPGSFDPFTRGHEAIVEQALELFDRVVIAVGYNVAKSGLLDVASRKRLIDDLYAGDDRVECCIYDTLTSQEAHRVGAVAMIRGVRNTLDFETERTLDAVNRTLTPSLKTVAIFPPAALSHISSSAVRELLKFGAQVEEMMPQGVSLDNYIKQI